MSQKLFTELGLSPQLLQAVEKMGFEKASPIQAESIPPLMEGRDMIGQSQTGSGKTAAFGIPAIERVDPLQRHPQVLILCPTRELASQVAEEIAKLAFFKEGVRELPLYGGASYERQFRGLKAGPQIVIGTPGRLIDMIERRALDLSKLKTIILDEADRMLDMGFREDIETILKAMPEERQTVLFSATLPPAIKRIIDTFTKDPVHVKIEATTMTVPAIEQSYVDVDWRSKTEVLCRLLDVHNVEYGIIFGFTKVQVDEVTDALVARGYAADKLHGDMSQQMRERVMKRFRERQVELLVATDVAARGLDVDDLEIVFNYELPHDPEDYVHRIGRTGRAGKSGKAISLVSGKEWGRMQQIIRFTKADIPRVKVPRMDEVVERQTGRTVDTIKATLDAKEFKAQDALIDELSEAGYSPAEIVGALMHLYIQEVARPVEKIREDDPRGAERRPRENRFERGNDRFADRGGRFERGNDRFGGGEDRGFAPPRRFEDRPPRRDFSGDERPPHRERVADSGGSEGDGNWVKLSVGRTAGVTPRDVVGAIANEAQVPVQSIGTIQILPSITLVQIGKEHVQQVISAMNGANLLGQRCSAMPGSAPRPPGERPAFGGGGDRGGFGGGFRGPPRRDDDSRGGGFRGGFGGGGGGGFRGPRRDDGGGYGGPPRREPPPWRRSEGRDDY
jgi:ATP-dependent RNA helicase DeaD